MARVGKLIMVRLPGEFPLLRPATAVAVDPVSGSVVILQPICGETIFAPENCFEFAHDLMEAINSLVSAAVDKIDAAKQLAAIELEQAVLTNDNCSEGVKVYH